MANIVFDTYGKSRVRLTYLQQLADRHEVKELSVDIFLEGDFQDAFRKGQNSTLLPTETMKNTVYVLARKKPLTCIEEFAQDLGRHFLAAVPHVSQARIEIEQVPWAHIDDSAAAFVQAGLERRTACFIGDRSKEAFRSGIGGLQILKTADSGFAGFLRDEYTTLAETNDRLLGTVLKADWLYNTANVHFNQTHAAIRDLLLSTFAAHKSLSVQQTLYEMGAAVLERFPSVGEIHLVMPNKHCLLVDLSRFGLDNPNQVFQPIDEPSGYIEARLQR